MSEQKVTSTILEKHIDALASAVMAFGYPSDAYARRATVVNCSAIGIDYVEALAGALEHTIPSETPPDVAAATARWAVVDHIANMIHGLRQAGALPREGVLTSGLPCNARGTAIEDDDEEEYV